MQVIRKPDSATNTEIAHGPSHGAPQWDRTTLRNATARSPCKDEISFLSVTISSVLPQGVVHDNRMFAERTFYCIANGAGEQ